MSDFLEEYDHVTTTGSGMPTNAIVIALKIAIGEARGLVFTCDETSKHGSHDWAPYARRQHSEFTSRCELGGSNDHPEPSYAAQELADLCDQLSDLGLAWLAESGNKPYREVDRSPRVHRYSPAIDQDIETNKSETNRRKKDTSKTRGKYRPRDASSDGSVSSRASDVSSDSAPLDTKVTVSFDPASVNAAIDPKLRSSLKKVPGIKAQAKKVSAQKSSDAEEDDPRPQLKTRGPFIKTAPEERCWTKGCNSLHHSTYNICLECETVRPKIWECMVCVESGKLYVQRGNKCATAGCTGQRGGEESVDLEKDPSAYGRLESRLKPKSVRAFDSQALLHLEDWSPCVVETKVLRGIATKTRGDKIMYNVRLPSRTSSKASISHTFEAQAHHHSEV